MLKNLLTLAILTACGVFLTAAPVLAQQQDIEEVLRLTGMERQIGQVPLSIHAGLVRHQDKHESLRPEVFALLDRTVADSYDRRFLYQFLVQQLLDRYEADRVVALLSLLRSPVAEKMSRLEAEAAGRGDPGGLLEYTGYLNANPPAPRRLELILQLYEAAHTTQVAVHLQALTYAAMLQAVNLANPPEKRLDEDELAALHAAMKAQLTASYDEVAAVIYLYTYRKASDEELKKFIEFYRSEPVQWYAGRILSALEITMDEAARRLAARLSESL